MIKERVFCLILLIAVGNVSRAAENSKRNFVRVAVVPFVNISGIEERDAWGGYVVDIMLTSRLSPVKEIVTYNSLDLMIHLKQLDKTLKDCYTKEVALTLGKRCVADWVMYGTLSGRGEEIMVSIKLLEIAKNQEQMLYSGKMDESGLLELDIILSKKLVEVLQIKEATISPEKATDKKMAFEYYAKGISAWNEGIIKYSSNNPETFELALKFFKKATDIDPNFCFAFNGMAVSLGKLGMIYGKEEEFSHKALPYLKIAIRLNPINSSFHANYGNALKRISEYDKAIYEYKKAIELNENNIYAHLNLGVVFKKVGKLTLAEKEYNRSISLCPEIAAPYVNLANMFYMNNLKIATNYAKKAIEINPEDYYAHNTFGLILSNNRNYKGAIGEFEIASKLLPSRPEAYFNSSLVFWEIGKINQAEALALKALSLNPKFAKAYYPIGMILCESGDINRAIDNFAKGIELEPNIADFHLGLGIAFGRQGNIQEAITELNQAIQLNPHLAGAHGNLGIALLHIGDNEQAIEELELAINLDPYESSLYNSLALAYLAKGNVEKAKNVVHRANEKGLNKAIKDDVLELINVSSF